MQDMTSLHNRFKITGVITTKSGMRIGVGRSASITGSDMPIVLDSQNRPFIPGSSIKGVFRTQAEQIINAFITSPTDPTDIIEKDNATRKLEEFSKRDDAAKYEYIIKNSNTNEIVKLFGSTLLAGRIFFRDALVVDNSFSYIETRNGVKINRDTGTQESGKLYDYDTVPAGVNFTFELAIENVTDVQLGLVLLLLDSWKSNGFQIGGFTRRGLGWMSLTEYSESFHEVKTPQDLIALISGTSKPLDETRKKACFTALTESLTPTGA